jgi:hypothetical protein
LFEALHPSYNLGLWVCVGPSACFISAQIRLILKFFFDRWRKMNFCPDLCAWFRSRFTTNRKRNRWMQVHCKLISTWFCDNIVWAVDALMITVTHVPFVQIAHKIAMVSHQALPTLYAWMLPIALSAVCRVRSHGPSELSLISRAGWIRKARSSVYLWRHQ